MTVINKIMILFKSESLIKLKKLRITKLEILRKKFNCQISVWEIVLELKISQNPSHERTLLNKNKSAVLFYKKIFIKIITGLNLIKCFKIKIYDF